MRRIRQYPWMTIRAALTGKMLRAVADTPQRCRESFFSVNTPEPEVVKYCARLKEESVRASLVDMTVLNLPRPKRVTAPLLVLAAECDGMFTPEEQRTTARAYRTEAEVFPDIGHDMMLEPAREAIAQRIHMWLGSHGL